MAEVFRIQSKDSVLRLNQYDAISCVQNFDWDPQFNPETFSQLGDIKYTAQAITPETSGSFEVQSTGSTVAMLKRMITQFNDATGEFEGYLAQETPDNAGTIRETDLERAIFDLQDLKRPNEVFSRCTLLPRQQLSSLSIRADVNGAATETYSFEGDFAELYPDPYHDLISIPLTRSAGTPETVLDVPAAYEVEVEGGTDEAIATHLVVALYIDDVVVPAANIVPNWTTNVFDGTVTLTGGYTAPLGSRLSLIVYKNTPGPWPTITYPTTARFLKADKIDVWLVAPGTVDIAALADNTLNAQAFADADLVLRAQSLDINVDMRREPLRQLRNNNRGTSVYYRAATFPLAITANLQVLESNLKEWARLQGKDIETSDILNLRDFENQVWQLVMRAYKGNTVLQTTALLDARVEGMGRRIAVGGNAEVAWSFGGSALRIDGSNG